MSKLEQLQRKLKDMGANADTVVFTKAVRVRGSRTAVMSFVIDASKSVDAARDRIALLENAARIDRRVSGRDATEIRRRMRHGRHMAMLQRHRSLTWSRWRDLYASGYYVAAG